LAFLTCVLLHMCWRGQFERPEPHHSSGDMNDE
jgi:hypothetical protein